MRMTMRRRVRTLGAAMLAAAMAGCAAFVPPVDKEAMQRRLRSQLPQIVRYADLSLAAYVPRNAEPSCHDTAVVTLDIPCFGVKVEGARREHRAIYLVDTSGDVQVVAVRGTANLEDALIDLDTRRASDDPLGTALHTGFRRVAEAIYRDIRDKGRLDPSKPVVLTGHSLGGAAALVLGLYMRAEQRTPPYQVQGIFTYGQPKVFSNDGAAGLFWINESFIRVVNCGDPVTIVPVSESKGSHFFRLDWLTGNRLTDYQHLGQLLLLMPGGRFWMPGTVDVERELPGAAARTLIGALRSQTNEHSMELYVDRLAQLSGAPLPSTSDSAAIAAAARYRRGAGAERAGGADAVPFQPDGHTPCAVPGQVVASAER
ncbi:lipase family protein [Siccirubricoccus sp. KC 17139]|uniref:Lipase family protein n=1 Tax=Siccirubricoccus soli TaxID=2899147 RepID=A0ABT1D263_9PROT|nr:lipase family protein [Siccirubricoccus soli]MCO6415697.1 lipase family protein [Siccirubricoccus soli]MCP2681829.1 lipase family protein [Siccirubricoccus soli]